MAWGGGGGGGGDKSNNSYGGDGGGGGFVQATVSVTQNESLTVYVGGGGGAGPAFAGGGGGGGYSGVWRGSDSLVIAGGGGGGGGDSDGSYGVYGGAGGAGGGMIGVSGGNCAYGSGGGGGTQSAVGSGGTGGYWCNGSNGSGNSGGAGCASGGLANNGGTNGGGSGGNYYGGSGGGGGGYYGGGGGASGYLQYAGAGGGGGSSFATSTATNVTLLAGSGRTPGNTGNRYVSGIGVGGLGAAPTTLSAGVAGNNGYVIIIVGDSLTNFPMLFSVTDPDLKFTSNSGKVASSTGADILFTSYDGTKLNHQIEKYASTTGQLTAWVQVPALSSSADTILYIYFGNASATDQQNSTAVWDSNYKGVWHMADGTTFSATDSLGVNNGSPSSVTADTGQIYGAGNFNGTSSYITGSMSNVGMTATVSCWVKPAALSFRNQVVFSHDAGGNNGYSMSFNNLYPRFSLEGVANYDFSTLSSFISVGSWSYYVITISGNNGVVTGYLNGIAESQSIGTVSGTPSQFNVGRRGDGNLFFSGVIDECRISNSIRSYGWIQTEYKNQSSPSTFYAYGSGIDIQNRPATTAGVSARGGSRTGVTLPAVKVRGGIKYR
jgi:hypothetical protein